jgi:plasmid stabilization system protein ParE
MNQIRFSEIANDELTDACDWYDGQQEGLGVRFKSAVRDAAKQIAQTPLLFPVELEDVRRYVMNRFPYTLRYVVREDEVWVVAVSHQHRRPDYWVERIDKQ